MQIRWTEEAADGIEQTLNYWEHRNGTSTYSNKILDETEKAVHQILENPYIRQYSEILSLYKKTFFKGKFVRYYKIDEQEETIWITDFRSTKQLPVF